MLVMAGVPTATMITTITAHHATAPATGVAFVANGTLSGTGAPLLTGYALNVQ